MVKLKCNRKRYLLSGVTSLVFLIVMVVCILFITQRDKELNNTRDVHSNENDTLETGFWTMDLVNNQLTLESESSIEPILGATIIPEIQINGEEKNKEPENNTSDGFTEPSVSDSIQPISRAIRILRIPTNETVENEELNNRTSDVSTPPTALEVISAPTKVKTICAKQERDQLKRHRDEEHAQLLRIRENEHELREIEHGQLFDMIENEKVLIEKEHDLKMKILSEKLLYYQRLNNNGAFEDKI